ncbi:MAG: ferrous iron transporter B [Clostridia bacterium]|nr:ferrous iron transporter B [Clostridia bacterium]
MPRALDRLDFLLCRPIVGLPVFFFVMYGVFFLSFSKPGEWMSGYTETILFGLTEALADFLLSAGTNPKAASVINGILNNTASVLAYLPQTAIFFFLIKGLEDCGYLSRVIFTADRFLSRFGLSGHALLPFLIGFGCYVPAMEASRTLTKNERKILKDSLPFLICSARLPVLFFLCEAFFPKRKAFAAFAFYLLCAAVFFLSSLIASRGKAAPPLAVLLPDFRLPKLRILFGEAWKKSRDYLIRTATVIFLCAVCLRICSIPISLTETEEPKNLLSLFGETLSFLFVPLGFGKPPFAAALFSGFFAKENLMFVMEMLSPKEISSLLSLPARISFTAFSMLYLPCFSSAAAVCKEWGAKEMSVFLLRTFVTAYSISWILYTLSEILVAFVQN